MAAQPVPGRPPKLSRTQEKIVGRWLADSPTEYGFATELWSAPHLARLIEQEWGVCFHPAYLTTWLQRRGFTPQKPQRVRANVTTRPSSVGGRAIGRASKSPPATRPILFLDESGCYGPAGPASLASRGGRPPRAKGRHREKVSVAAALWLTPLRNRVAWPTRRWSTGTPATTRWPSS